MTATLQVLSNIPRLKKTFLSDSYEKDSVTEMLSAFFNKLRTQTTPFSEFELFRDYLIKSIHEPRMAIGQHDARNFITKLLHILDPKIKQKFNIGLNTDQICKSKKHRSKFSFVERELPLDIPDQQESVSIKKLLNDFLNKSQYFEFYECKECNDRTGLDRKISIQKLPEILPISIKRFKQEKDVIQRKDTPVSASKTI